MIPKKFNTDIYFKEDSAPANKNDAFTFHSFFLRISPSTNDASLAIEKDRFRMEGLH